MAISKVVSHGIPALTVADIVGLQDKPKTFLATALNPQIERCALYFSVLPLLKQCMDQYPKIVPSFEAVVGLELEIEQLPGMNGFDLIPWEAKPDGSLRNNGVEFITCPIQAQSVVPSLALLEIGLGKVLKQQPAYSWRTSTHIHLNIRHFTAQQLYSFLILYQIFEPYLFEFAGVPRKKSPFCIPLADTSYPSNVAEFARFLEQEGGRKFVLNLSSFWEKYSSLNLSRLHDLGTVEFRHLGGSADFGRIVTWVNLILLLHDHARGAPFEKIKKEVMTLNTLSHYGVFVDSIFGKFAPFPVTEAVERLVSEGVRSAKQMLCPQRYMDSIPQDRFSSSALFALFKDRIEAYEKQGPTLTTSGLTKGQYFINIGDQQMAGPGVQIIHQNQDEQVNVNQDWNPANPPLPANPDWLDDLDEEEEDEAHDDGDHFDAEHN